MRLATFSAPAAGVLAIVSASLASPAQAAPILNPANGHYYDVVNSAGIGWFSAKTAALGMSHAGLQGHLVTITSAAEQNFIVSNLPGALGSPTSFGYWIGGLRTISSSSPLAYTWVTGEAFSYTNFAPGEPNGDLAPAGLHFFGQGNIGGWNDVNVNFPSFGGFVVEFEATVPAPGALALFSLGLLGVGALRRRKR